MGRQDEIAEVYPYIPNSPPAIRAQMLAAVGAATAEDLYAAIPEHLRFRSRLEIPQGIAGEFELRSHLERLLGRNRPTGEVLSFLGGGCWPHFIPAVCDEMASRGEFLTGYHDGASSMLGSYQAQFEFQSMIGALVGLDMVSTTTYDWGSAAASSLLMASRITGRTSVKLPALMSPMRRRQIEAIAGPSVVVETIDADPTTGGIDVEQLARSITGGTAAVYIEVPAYLGTLEPHLPEIGELAHRNGAQLVVGIDPISLGVLTAPADYGADIVCGDIQPLGVHMSFGGGLAGFIATRHEPAYIRECPTLLVSILETRQAGEFAFGWWNFEQTSYAYRGESDDFAGTTQTIWAIVAATYLAVMGPQGLREVGEAILARSSYAMDRLSRIPGVSAPTFPGAAHFKEFVLNFDRSGKTVRAVMDALRERGIYGGIDLSDAFPAFGQSVLACVTEVHSVDDIDRYAAALEEVLR
jgi:glycine dehydrogenase subunit 1